VAVRIMVSAGGSLLPHSCILMMLMPCVMAMDPMTDLPAVPSVMQTLSKSWTSPLTPETEARGYLMIYCNQEQMNRHKNLIAQFIRIAGAVNRVFVEPGVVRSTIAQPWAINNYSAPTCNDTAIGGARLYWDMPHLREASRKAGSDIVDVDAMRDRVQNLESTGSLPKGFDSLLTVLHCREELGACPIPGSFGKFNVTRPHHEYVENMQAQLLKMQKSYLVVISGFERDPNRQHDDDIWFRPSPALFKIAYSALCHTTLDPCKCANARCAPKAAKGSYVAVQWRSEASVAGRMQALEGCADLILMEANTHSAALAASLKAESGRESCGGGDSNNKSCSSSISAPPGVFLGTDLFPGTSKTYPPHVLNSEDALKARTLLLQQFDQTAPSSSRLSPAGLMRKWLLAVGSESMGGDPGVRAQLESIVMFSAGKLIADVRPQGSRGAQCTQQQAYTAACACTCTAGSSYAAMLGEHYKGDHEISWLPIWSMHVPEHLRRDDDFSRA